MALLVTNRIVNLIFLYQENGSFEIVFDLIGYEPNPDTPMYVATFTTPDSGVLNIRSLFHHYNHPHRN